ncbi:MAG: porin [Candidatus Krumholzibacteriota bacterium]|nr:porin [Candidatus Krumholzibacteriota bacterium]
MFKRVLMATFLITAIFHSGASAGELETKIYGYVHVSVDNLSDGDESSIYVSSNTSRIGFKGSLLLDNDLSFFWQIENQVNFDETGKDFASRATFAGISGDFGKVYFGREETPSKMLYRKIDLFSNYIGDTRNIAGVGGYGFNLRVDNAIAYKTPDLRGINGFVLIVPEEGEDETSFLSASMIYEKSAVFAGISYEQHGTALTEFDDRSENGLRLAGSYSWEKYRLVGSFERLANINGARDVGRKTFGLGASFKAHEKMILKAQYNVTGGLVVDGDKVDDTGAKIVTAGIDLPAGDNTKFYGAWSVAINDPEADYACTGGGHGEIVVPEIGDNPTGLSIGIIHRF